MRTLSTNASELLQALTLWFVVMVFLQTASGDAGPAGAAIAVVSVVLVRVIPLYLLREALVRALR